MPYFNDLTHLEITKKLNLSLMSVSNLSPATYYKFANGAETTDSSANANTLTAIGVPVQGTPKFGTGCVGYGTSQAHSAADGADFKPAGNFSVSAWIRTNKTGTLQGIFQSYSQNTNRAGITLIIDTTNFAYIYSGKNSGTTQGTDWQRHNGSTNVCDGAWHHLVGTYDGAKLHLYLDGTEQGTGTAWANAAAFAATNYVRVGTTNNSGSNGNYFQGVLDEVCFYPSDALSSAEVTTLATNSINSTAAAAIKAKASAIYLFENGAQLTDSKGANTLTAIGTPITCTSVSSQTISSIFLGNSSAYSASDAAVLKPTGSFTIGSWVKTFNVGVNQQIFQSYSQNTNIAGIQMRIYTGNKLVLYSGKNTGTTQSTDFQLIVGNTTITDNVWHFCVGTWDGSTLRIYVDGKLDGSVAWDNAPVYAATNYVRVGAASTNGSNANYFQGQLNETFLLNGRSLNPIEVYNLYKSYMR